MAGWSSTSRSGLAATAIIAALAVLVLLLVIYALRSPSVANEGESPGPAPTWTRSSAPPPTESEAAAATPSASVAASPQLLATLDGRNAVRAERGECEISDPVATITVDGGATWAPVSFGAVSVKEILAVDYVNESQINMIAKVGAECAVSMVTSFTSGQYWASYPDRLGEGAYYDARVPATAQLYGATIDAPCDDVIQFDGTVTGAVALCGDALYVYSASEAIWQVLAASSALAVAASDDGQVLALEAGSPTCDGVVLVKFDLAEVAQGGTEVSCLTREQAQPEATLALSGPDAMLWAGASVLTSADQGASWAPAG